MKFQKPTGMRDILEEDLRYFQMVEKVCQEIADFYSFKRIETPLLEQSGLFEKSSGSSSEIVQKQMFTLTTKGGDNLVLRPEGTPPLIRAYLENGMESWPKPVRLWHFGPFFRYEKPQEGRYRQFFQAGFEVIGSSSWIIDAQVIQIFYNILNSLGFKDLVVEVNSLGDSQCRPYYKKVLANYLKRVRDFLCADCRRRLKINCLRVLDCKNEKCQEVVRKGVPQILNHLCHDCHNHFKNVLEALEEIGVPYNLNPYLVRGLDYYTRTVFEISENSPEGSAQGSLAGGGRYDDLVKLLGGKETPACGGAIGVDRLVNVLKARSKSSSKASQAKIFLAQVGDFPKMKMLRLMESFRKTKIKVFEGLDKDSLSAQLKLADKLGVRYVLILGQQEALNEEIIVRDMEEGEQKTIPLEKVVKEMEKKIKK